MKIAIIGGGWVGCHLANKLKDYHDITIFEKNEKLFLESSYNNQNRLHRGYHYARNSKTRELCEHTFYRFLDDYNFLVKTVNNNAYAVAEDSLIDYGTYKKIFYDYNFSEVDLGLSKLKKVLIVDERYINFKLAHEYFNEHLKDLVKHEHVLDVNSLKENYNLIINCTNNHIQDPTCENAFYELTVTLLFKKKIHTPFEALTLVDGDFFSIYPYENSLYSVSDVLYTPIQKFDNIEKLNKFYKEVRDIDVEGYKDLIVERIERHYPEFSNFFEYQSYYLATKAKFKNSSADRYPVINKQDNVINCFTGKIQGIYVIEDFVRNEIARR